MSSEVRAGSTIRPPGQPPFNPLVQGSTPWRPTCEIGGKTVTRRLTHAELADYQPLFDNAKRLRALLTELQDLTLQIIEADRRQQPHSAEPET